MVTSGFFNSLNHDRRYDALQFGSIFDGILRDGIFMSIGTCFRVIPSEDMMVLAGIGRAWFDHTWTLNDAPLPIFLPQSEVLLDRIDAIVIDVNNEQDRRINDIIVVKGTPSKTPQRPTLIKKKNHNQYPLAYISVRAGVTSIRAADITSMVGTSETPYVTGILDTVNIDALLDQWKDQWKEFFEGQTLDMETANSLWKREWQLWYEAQTNEIQDAYLAWQSEWSLWSSNYKTEMENTADEWKDLWNAWFYSYMNENQQMISEWQHDRDTEFRTWFDSLKTMLEPDVATNLARRISELESCCGIVKDFITNLTAEHAIYDELYDNSWSSYGNVLDSDNMDVLDSDSDAINGRSYASEPILDSDGHTIGGRVIFVTK